MFKVFLMVVSITCAIASMIYARKARRTADQVLEEIDSIQGGSDDV